MNRAVITCDLGFGDAGKGTIVDYLVRALDADGVVRFNGGAQAAHNVITPDGRHHTFSSFGSGTFIDGVWTHLSRHVMVSPLAVFTENAALHQLGVVDALQRLSVDADCPITTPFHVAANRLRELGRGDRRHGSCGVGIGETMMDVLAGCAIRARDLLSETTLRTKLADTQQRKRDELQWVIDTIPGAAQHAEPLLSRDVIEDVVDIFLTFAKLVRIRDDFQYEGTIIFEAAQGVLLDQDFGFHPHTTWSRATTANARELLAGFTGEVTSVGIVRSYMTRHGAGPLPTEDPQLAPHTPELHNGHGEWQGAWRVGHPDLVALRYAARAAGHLDFLAVTHMDVVRDGWQVCTGYQTGDGVTLRELPTPGSRADQQQLTDTVTGVRPVYERCDDLLAAYEAAAGVPVGIVSEGPIADDKRLLPAASLPQLTVSL